MNIQQLHKNILRLICCSLSKRDLLNFMKCNKFLSSLLDDEQFWFLKYKYDYSGKSNNQPWKTLYLYKRLKHENTKLKQELSNATTRLYDTDNFKCQYCFYWCWMGDGGLQRCYTCDKNICEDCRLYCEPCHVYFCQDCGYGEVCPECNSVFDQ